MTPTSNHGMMQSATIKPASNHGGGGTNNAGHKAHPGDTPAAVPRKKKSKDGADPKKPGANSKAAKLDVISIGDDGYNHRKAPSLEQKVRVEPGKGVFSERYSRGRELGLGAFSNVFLGTHRSSRNEYAIKKIDREKMIWGDSRDALEDEVNHLILVRNVVVGCLAHVSYQATPPR